ncbi:MAG: pyrroline-5-carboxylate reductase [Planctomycetaceae bacterium]|nr:pyrroline-5-carboxylate reductase [Planctomycetaceae bacterium]
MPTIGFLGAGKMATALAKGLIDAGFARAEDILASDVVSVAREQFEAATGARTTSNGSDVLAACDVICLAVKPQVIPQVLQSLRSGVDARHLFVSIAAGISLARLTEGLGATARIVRVMPNTPALVGAGASGFTLGGAATEDDGQLVRELLQTVGIAIEVPERLLDAVTGLSGSGPAYGFQIIEALSDGGVRMGLPRDVATQLAAQTLLGAARMVLETGIHPGALKDAVTSPAGTTIAGLHALEQGCLRAALMNAVQAATQRSIELGSA